MLHTHGLTKCEALKCPNIKNQVFWDMMPHELVNRYWCFRGACCIHLQSSPRKWTLSVIWKNLCSCIISMWRLFCTPFRLQWRWWQVASQKQRCLLVYNVSLHRRYEPLSAPLWEHHIAMDVSVKVKFTLKLAIKAKWGSTVLLFLGSWH